MWLSINCKASVIAQVLFLCLQCNFSKKTTHFADTWTPPWIPHPLPSPWFHHLPCLFSITRCWHLCHAPIFFFFRLLSPIPYFCSPPLPSLSPVLSPSDPPLPSPNPHPPSPPLSGCRTPPYDGANPHTAGLSLTRTHAHARTHKQLDESLSPPPPWFVFGVVLLTHLASSLSNNCRSPGSASPSSRFFHICPIFAIQYFLLSCFRCCLSF